jgi:hypothetical protein
MAEPTPNQKRQCLQNNSEQQNPKFTEFHSSQTLIFQRNCTNGQSNVGGQIGIPISDPA